MVKNLKIVVTGASGFVAKNLRKYLSEKNIDLMSISRSDFKNFKCETKIISKNYNEKDILKKIKNSDALIHLAGIGKQSVNTDFDLINTDLTKHIVNLCKKAKIKKIIYLSGLGVSPNTSLGYFISKYNAERQITNSGLDFIIFRPSYIIGKDDLLSKYLKKQMKSGEIKIPGSGKYLIQPISISDVVKVIFESTYTSKFNNEIIDLVGPDHVSFEKYVKLFSKGTNTKIRKVNLEDVYRDAITNQKSDFGIDDLNILIGNFKGNYKKLSKISKIKFQSVMESLQSG
ncbi:MAG: NAD(P)H-binding protein [Nitrosopumilus sp.]|uniref:SDR family oxidoreductase n=1 Tax=Nitrosopumilus sp. TaxID=2024843 RepID=UPI00246FACCA|nr:NAD-dependent epimerase/dehydratase family protein [Nitrosopumilus sp.]MDH5430801.1 NAD(P)H-binding protein [Nitrosopumilus sp.]MDH5698227.1 NAD(P)H-binding protein [Nitrosopumilus sp.]